MQANNAKAMNAHAEVIKALVKAKEVKAKEVKPKIPKGSSHSSVNLLTLLTPSSGNMLVPTSPRVSGSAGQRPRPRPRPKPSPRLQMQLWLRLQNVPRPLQRLHSGGLCLPM